MDSIFNYICLAYWIAVRLTSETSTNHSKIGYIRSTTANRWQWRVDKVATMRTFMSIVFFSALVNFVLCRPENKMYTTKYDELDVNALLKSERLLMIYVGCLLDEKPCTADGAELKSEWHIISSSWRCSLIFNR